MHRLRKALESVASNDSTELIASTGSGYLLRADAAQLDVLRFTELADRALASDDPAAAADGYDQALACWRGPTLGDLPESVRDLPAVNVLDRRRLRIALARADLADVLGDYQRVVPMLLELADAEPLNEGLAARLVICLAGSGEATAALARYAEIRRRLHDELGIEPDGQLREAQLRVLRQRVVPGHLRNQATPRLTRFTLPRDVEDFTGRTSEIDSLAAPATAVWAWDGMAGVGKTTLAVHVAHRLAPHYPDAQLFVDLQGNADPLSPHDALLRLLSGLGIKTGRTPVDLAGCLDLDLWRRWSSGHRALVVLDDASSAEQIRPLLPAGTARLPRDSHQPGPADQPGRRPAAVSGRAAAGPGR